MRLSKMFQHILEEDERLSKMFKHIHEEDAMRNTPIKTDTLSVVQSSHINNILKQKALESDPNGIGQHEPGAKVDAGKPMAGILGDFGLAMMSVAEVGTFGANKYSRGGWQSVPNGIERYTDAMWRHILKEKYDKIDADSNCLHAAQIAWNALARLELMLREPDFNA